MSEFEKMSLVELRIAGRNLGLKNVTTYKKQELLEKILELEESSQPVKKAPRDNKPEGEEEKTRRPERTRNTARNNNGYNNYNNNNNNFNASSNNSNNNNNASSNSSNYNNRNDQNNTQPSDMEQLDSGEIREGILEVMQEGYGFIRCDNYLPGDEDVYVSPALIRKYHLRTGDILKGNVRVRNQNEKFGALL